MSELTTCNYCTLQNIRARARKNGLQVTIEGSNCYVHPRWVKLDRLNKDEKEPYFVAWFMELTDHCVC